MTEVNEEIGKEKILAVITDNASAMIKARELVKEEFDHISVYICADHCLNLLIEDIGKLQTFDQLIKDANSIVKEINGPQVIRVAFKLIQKQVIHGGLEKKIEGLCL